MTAISRARQAAKAEFDSYLLATKCTASQMEAAIKAALMDAAAAEADGYPTPETAGEWLAAMDYRIRAEGGGLAEFNARPEIADGIVLATKALVAAALLAVQCDWWRGFGSYMPLASVGHYHYDVLLRLAYNAPSSKEEWANWSIQIGAQKAWKKDTQVAVEAIRKQWSNSDWVWQAKRVLAWAVGRLPE